MTQRHIPGLMGALAALLWAVAHVVVHAPRGFPDMNVLGEWDLLLTALAIAGGDAPDAAIGTLHGNELGSWLVAWLVAIPVWLGMDPVAAGKWVATAFGAASAGVIGWLATRLATEAGPLAGDATCDRRKWTIAAGALTGLLVATTWPGLHFELQGVNGRTPESLLFQLIAVAVVVTSADGGVRARGILAGAALSLGWLMSPVALWTAAATGAVFLWMQWPDIRRGAEALGALGLGFVGVLALFALLVPGGTEGLSLFWEEQFGLGVTGGDAGRLGFAVFGVVDGALEGGAHNPHLSLRPRVLGVVGWMLVLGLAIAPGAAAWARRWRDPAALTALIGLSWLAPLAMLPLDKWFYPLAYRYWVLLLALGFAVVPGWLLLRLGKRGMIGAPMLALAALLVVPTLPRSIVAPSASRAEALVSSGAHRMNPRPGRDRHAAFAALFPHVAATDAAPLAEGYGLALGGDFAVDVIDERAGEPPWVTIRPELAPDVRAAFLVGVGCGVTAVGTVPQGALDAFGAADPADAWALWSGLQRCGGPVPDGALDESPLPSQVSNPAELMPPRWTGGPPPE